MPGLLHDIRQVQEVRAMIARAERELLALGAGPDGGASAAERFALRTRIGAMRHDDARLTTRLRREACDHDPSLQRRFDRLMLLVDEVVVLAIEAEADASDAMRAAMAQQAEGELATEAAALAGRVAALPARPALRLVDRVG